MDKKELVYRAIKISTIRTSQCAYLIFKFIFIKKRVEKYLKNNIVKFTNHKKLYI